MNHPHPLVIGIILAMAGCITDSQTDLQNDIDPPDRVEILQSHQEWAIELKTRPFIPEGDGEPFVSTGSFVAGGCTFFDLRVPNNTTSMGVDLVGSADSPGFGYMTFEIRQKGEPWQYPGPVVEILPGTVGFLYTDTPREQTTMEITDPPVGDWQIWVWPHGIVVQQTWDLTITLQGTGPEPDVSLAEEEFFCGADPSPKPDALA